MEPQVDWAGLPGDLLTCIGALCTVPGRICFRAVCRTWRAAVQEAIAMPPPWVVIPRVQGFTDSFTFLSVPTMKAFRWSPPGGARARCVGSNGGWLAMVSNADGSEEIGISLVNPLTDACVKLPSMSTGCSWDNISPRFEEICLGHSVRKLVFAPSPSAGDYTAAIVTSAGYDVSYNKAGPNGFRRGFANLPRVHGGEGIIPELDVAYHDGKFYFMAYCGQVWVLDIDAPSPSPTPLAKFAPPVPGIVHQLRGYHLAFSGDGALHLVWSRSEGDGASSASGSEMLARRYDPGSSSWTHATSLGDRAFLIGDRNQSLSVPVDGSGGAWLRADSVYFANIPLCSLLAEHGRRGVWVFDVVTGEISWARSNDDGGSPEGQASKLELELDWDKSVWFMPCMR